MECTHPGERELHIRRAPSAQCETLVHSRLVRWRPPHDDASPQSSGLVCRPFERVCRASNATTPYVDVEFDVPAPIPEPIGDEPWGYVSWAD